MHRKHTRFSGRIVVVGFGSIGQGVMPLILRHIDMPRENILVITGDERGREVAAAYGVAFAIEPLIRDNLRQVLTSALGRGDFLLNLSVDVSSVELIKLA